MHLLGCSSVMTLPKAQRQSHTLVSDALISVHIKRIYLQIYRVVQHVDDAQELTQDVFIRALSNAASLTTPDKAAHWLSRIASNVAIDFLRRRRCRPTVNLAALDDLADTGGVDPECSAILHEQYRHSLSQLNVLTDRERTALLLRDVEDWRTAEVALHMNCSHATVRSHIANARVKLRKRRVEHLQRSCEGQL